MKILHLYPKSDSMIAQHVSILTEGMRNSAEVQAVGTPGEYKPAVNKMQPDIIHCHGCWQYAAISALATGRKKGARVVISPHGQLEPWVLQDKSIHEKLQKTVLWQRRGVESAYALIAFGKMEQHHLRQLKWNPRIEQIKNSIITNSTTPQEMCSQTFAVYQKVQDSNVLEQMNDTTRQQLAAIIKAGITGDVRWTPTLVGQADYRRLLIYAEHQNIRNYVDYGMSILRLQPPILDTTKIAAFFPEDYQRPRPIKELIGEYQGNETDYLVRMIRQIQRQPLLLHLIELHRELLRDTVDDDRLQEKLEEKGLATFAARLMQILSEQTLIEEGYMPLQPIDDRGTRQLRNQIYNNLKI